MRQNRPRIAAVVYPHAQPESEQFARQQIDTQLVACGWVVQDKKAIDFNAAQASPFANTPPTQVRRITYCSLTSTPPA